VEFHQIETGRLRMTWRESGDPNGPPLLLLHGAFATSRWWEPLAGILPSEFRLIAPDLRGCGGTGSARAERPNTGYEIESQCDDLTAFVDALGLSSFTLVAHGGTSAIAVEYTLSHPDSVERLVLISPAPLEGIETPREALDALDAMREDRTLLERGIVLLAPATAAQEPEFFATLVEDAAQMDPAAFSANALSLAHWNRGADARLLTLPSLIIWGDRDPIVDRTAAMHMLVSLPGAENLDIMRGVGHSPMLDDPLGLAERIVDFVTSDDSDFAAVRASVS